MDADCYAPAEPPLLPLLSLPEAHDVLVVLAAVVHGGDPDREVARGLLMNWRPGCRPRTSGPSWRWP